MGVGLGGRDCVDPRDAYLACRRHGVPVDSWLGRANEFVSPLGAGPGRGWLLMRAENLDALDFEAEHDLTFSDQLAPVTLRRVHVVEARCVLASVEGDPGDLYLLEVADRRRWIAGRLVNRGYNLRDEAGAYLTATLKSEGGQTPWTWEQVAQDLWEEHLGEAVLGAFPGLPAQASPPTAYDDHPENLLYPGRSALGALEHVLERLGLALRYDPVADTFSVVITAEADAAWERDSTREAGRRTWDLYARASNLAHVPEKVWVRFKKTGLANSTHDLSPYYVVEVAAADTGVWTSILGGATVPAGVQAGTAVVLRDDLSARMSSSTTPDNLAELRARAEHRARDYYGKVRDGLPRLQRVYAGSPAGEGLRPGARVTAVRWEDRGGGLKTELVRVAVDDWLERWGPAEPEVPGGVAVVSTPAGSGSGSGSGAGDPLAGPCAALPVGGFILVEPEGGDPGDARLLVKGANGYCLAFCPCDATLPGGTGGGAIPGGGGILTDCCPLNGLPETLHLNIITVNGPNACLAGKSFPMTWDGSKWDGSGQDGCDGCTWTVMEWSCSGDVWTLNVAGCINALTAGDSDDCDTPIFSGSYSDGGSNDFTWSVTA